MNILLKQNVVSVTIVVFIFIYLSIVYTEPNIIYTSDGLLRQFGLGQSKKTIIPLWLASISIAILTYVGILYIVTLPRIHI
jgi:hypothetical protein